MLYTDLFVCTGDGFEPIDDQVRKLFNDLVLPTFPVKTGTIDEKGQGSPRAIELLLMLCLLGIYACGKSIVVLERK